jgi:hypothetical protein
VLLEKLEQLLDEGVVHGRVVVDVGERQRDMRHSRAHFHGARPLHAEARGIVGAELPDAVDPGARPRAALGRRPRQPARLREAPQVLQAAHLPHHLRVGAGLEEIDALAGRRRVVAHRRNQRVAVEVDARAILLAAILHRAEEEELPAQRRRSLLQHLRALLRPPLAQQPRRLLPLIRPQ